MQTYTKHIKKYNDLLAQSIGKLTDSADAQFASLCAAVRRLEAGAALTENKGCDVSRDALCVDSLENAPYTKNEVTNVKRKSVKSVMLAGPIVESVRADPSVMDDLVASTRVLRMKTYCFSRVASEAPFGPAARM